MAETRPTATAAAKPTTSVQAAKKGNSISWLAPLVMCNYWIYHLAVYYWAIPTILQNLIRTVVSGPTMKAQKRAFPDVPGGNHCSDPDRLPAYCTHFCG